MFMQRTLLNVRCAFVCRRPLKCFPLHSGKHCRRCSL